MEAFLGPRGELEEWLQSNLEACAHGVRTLEKISNRYPQSAYASLRVLLQLEWKYLQSTLPGVVSIMGPIEDSLREAFFLTLFKGK